jgi:hypothetical protein
MCFNRKLTLTSKSCPKLMHAHMTQATPAPTSEQATTAAREDTATAAAEAGRASMVSEGLAGGDHEDEYEYDLGHGHDFFYSAHLEKPRPSAPSPAAAGSGQGSCPLPASAELHARHRSRHPELPQARDAAAGVRRKRILALPPASQALSPQDQDCMFVPMGTQQV